MTKEKQFIKETGQTLRFIAWAKNKELQKKIITQDIQDDINHLKETGIPRCPVCKYPMVNAIDSITKKKSKYLWQTTCGHCNNLRMGLG